jgi:hypothetical protein
MNGLIGPPRAGRTRSAAALLAIGGVCGLAWAAGFRGFMARTRRVGVGRRVVWHVRPDPAARRRNWCSARMAEYIRRTGGRRGWRWPAVAPVAFPVLVSSRQRSSGGAQRPAAAGRRNRRRRDRGPLVWNSGRMRLVGARAGVGAHPARRGRRRSHPGLGVRVVSLRPGVCLTSPRGAWVALFYSFIVTLALACSIPHRPVVQAVPGASAGPAPPAVRPADRRVP